jgi:DNA-binding transcriptional LysR family regulator
MPIEKDLSVRLFEKVGRKMLLTSAGREFLPYVNEVLGVVDKTSYFKS